MKKYNVEEAEGVISTIRKATRASHKPATVTLEDGRSISGSAMGAPYTLKNADGSTIGRASDADALAELLNEQDGGLYRAWAESSDEAHELSFDIRRVDGGRDKLRQMASQLAASEVARAYTDISPRWSREFNRLTREARPASSTAGWPLTPVKPLLTGTLETD